MLIITLLAVCTEISSTLVYLCPKWVNEYFQVLIKELIEQCHLFSLCAFFWHGHGDILWICAVLKTHLGIGIKSGLRSELDSDGSLANIAEWRQPLDIPRAFPFKFGRIWNDFLGKSRKNSHPCVCPTYCRALLHDKMLSINNACFCAFLVHL